MANIEVKLRRGTTSQHSSFTGAEGEVTVDTDLDTLRVHDGSTAGGERLAKYSELSGAGAGGTVTSVDSGTGLTGGPVTTSGTLSIANDGVDTAQIAANAVTSTEIAADAVTSTEISSTDTTLNVNDTNNNIGTGALADANFQLTVDGGSGKDTIYAKGNQSGAYVDLNLENENAAGNGGRVAIVQGSNSAYFQYQESGERATLNLVDGGLSADAGITISCSSASLGLVSPTGSMASGSNSNVDLGSSSLTWNNGYINGGAWTGSDRNLKQDIEDLSEAELRVATALKGLMKKFRLKDAVAKKGDDARIHIGVIAQDVKAAFEAEGLDAYRYAIIGEDTWWSKQDEDGEWIIKNDNPNDATYTEYTKMSVRYEQLLAFIIAAM